MILCSRFPDVTVISPSNEIMDNYNKSTFGLQSYDHHTNKNKLLNRGKKRIVT